MSRKPRVHIIYRGDGWAVKREGNARAYRILRTQADAVGFAKKMYAKGTEIIVHQRDGSIKKWL